jgi:hypothetical protein
MVKSLIVQEASLAETPEVAISILTGAPPVRAGAMSSNEASSP